MKQRFTKGFTLIELLVVIAIIGVLSAMVLSQLNQARNKSADATIKSTIANATNAAQIYYDIHNSNTWNGVCSASNGLDPMWTRLKEIVGTTNAHCNGTGQLGWRLDSQLKTDPTKYWCSDYTGERKICNAVPNLGGYTCAVGC